MSKYQRMIEFTIFCILFTHSNGAGLSSIFSSCFKGSHEKECLNNTDLSNPYFNKYENKIARYLYAQRLIDDIHTFDHWTTMQTDVIDKAEKVLGKAKAAGFEFISLQKFKQSLLEMGEWLVRQGINDEDSAVALEFDGKSNGWVLANLMHYTNVRPKNIVTLSKTDLRIKKLFFVDDASYSGEQQKNIIEAFVEYHSPSMAVVGVPYITKHAKQRLEGRWRNGLTIYEDAHIIKTFYKGPYGKEYGLLAFEHKVGDYMSIPPKLSTKLERLYEKHLPYVERFPPYDMNWREIKKVIKNR